MSRERTRITESVLFEAIPAERIDREAGIVRGVRVLGSVSRNKRRYTEGALNDAVRIYEGLGVNLNHPDRKNPAQERLVQEQFGELRNVKRRGEAVYADHHFPLSDPYTPRYLEACERFPYKLGFSHVAEGDCRYEGDMQIVDSLTEAHSADLVTKPATNIGVFESEDQRRNVKELIEKSGSKQKIRELLFERFEQGMLDPQMTMEQPPAQASEDESVKAAFRAAIVAVFDNRQLSADETKEAIIRILDTGEMVSGKTQPTDEEPDMADSQQQNQEDPQDPQPPNPQQQPPTDPMPQQTPPDDPNKKKRPPQFESVDQENAYLRQRVHQLEAANDVHDLLQESKIPADKELVDSLVPLSEEQRKALIKRLTTPMSGPRSPRPQRSAPLRESQNPAPSPWTAAVNKTLGVGQN